MYETTKQIELKNKILQLVKQSKKVEIVSILYIESDKILPSKNLQIQFCVCGYPISYQIVETNENNEKVISKPILLEYILREETDFESYTISYFCPNCNKLLVEQKF